jgi:enediyne biosynthesis protein E4
MRPRPAYALLVAAVACGCLLWTFLSCPQSDAQEKSSRIDFRDATDAGGIEFTNVCGRPHQADYILESTGCGVAVFDNDRDGYPDIFLVNSSRFSGFEPGGEPTNHLYHNLGNGKFADVTVQAGLAKPRMASRKQEW